MNMKKWIAKIRAALIRDVATATVNQLQGGGWGKFLPPVAFRDCVYLMREDGTLYRMHQDTSQGMEIITQIKSHW